MRVKFVATLGSIVIAAATAVGVAHASPPSRSFTSELLHFSVHVGPNDAAHCNVLGELFVPSGLGPHNRAPAILTTNGFGGSYTDQVPAAQQYATRGYVALTYSGLGFGGSSCKISLDDPDYDGKAASQLVSFLGGQPGIAFTDAALTHPLPALDVVRLKPVDHNGVASPYDPRVGMIGGSYGGGIQFSAASVDPRIDTIIPMITWNDLSYSLAPNGTGVTSGVSTVLPGAAKVMFADLLFGSGVRSPGIQGYADDPARAAQCPNYIPFMCEAIAQVASTGEISEPVIDNLRHDSIATYVHRIKIPVLLAQGEQDTLFDLNEAVATYNALRAQGNTVKMIWQSWGHSHLAPAPGEFSKTDSDPAAEYESGRIHDWFDHYLMDTPVDTGPQFAYFRDWVPYTGNAKPAYASAPSFPVGHPHTLHLSAGGQLVDQPNQVRPGSQSIVTGPAGVPTGIEPLNILPNQNIPSVQIPGTQAQWTGARLTAPMDVVGIPSVTLRMQSPGAPVVFAKLYDVAPDGTASLIDGLLMPVRIANPAAPVSITLPGIVHRFDTGHCVRLAVTGGDISFRGGLSPLPVTIFADGSGPLSLPVTD